MAHIVVANDAGRMPKDLATHMGLFTMEDWVNIFKAFGPYLFHGEEVLPPELKRMWELLSRAACHYLVSGHPDETFTAAARAAARDALIELARIIERGVAAGRMPATLLTYTLHVVCHRCAANGDVCNAFLMMLRPVPYSLSRFCHSVFSTPPAVCSPRQLLSIHPSIKQRVADPLTQTPSRNHAKTPPLPPKTTGCTSRRRRAAWCAATASSSSSAACSTSRA